MEIGLRVLALVIDLSICVGTVPLVMNGLTWVMNRMGPASSTLLAVWISLLFIWPVLCLAVPTAIWGRTLGKLIFRLRVVDAHDRSPGLWRALGRETLKLLAACTMIGAVLTLVQCLRQGDTWYDRLCGTVVKFVPRLSATQKNWRRYMKERSRGG